MTQVLARKWRPRTFAELVGQEHVVRALANALDQQRLHHAYLFTGTRGVGKTTLARIIAKALNCETGVGSKPCGQCTACREIEGGRFVDLIELDAASNTQVDNMRELLESALYAPTAARFKVYIIDEVHMLSRSAFNAMLKTLEEPPAHVKFILATTDPQKIPVTVLSRCLQFNLKQIPPVQIQARLEHVLGAEGIAHEAAALHLIAQAAQGSLRDSLSLLDQAIAHGDGKVVEAGVREMLGAVDRSYAFDLLEALAAGDGAGLMAQAETLQSRSLSFDAALQELGAVLHNLAVLQLAPAAVSRDDPDFPRIEALARRFTPEELQLNYQIALQGRGDLGAAPDEFAGFTMTLLRMLAFAPAPVGSDTARPTETPRAAPPLAAVGRDAKQAVQPAAVPSADESCADLRIDDWPAFVKSLRMGGMAGMLAQHTELAACADGRLELRVPEAHKHLMEKAYQEKLRAVLKERCGSALRAVEISVGSSGGSTPAELDARNRQARQAEAIAAIEGDPFVRELVEDLGGRIVPDSIRPLS
ncbi:MAG: DNA polymerase III subunit gamma/tau [Betaproteobacteria bacterium]|nr:DNA polymerase III subunit gamma/tau [Betaproteobacteria bacterium]